jgi:predicted nucleic acid-binding protein
MRVHGLLDTGALVALLNESERWHRRCAEALPTLRLPLGVTHAVMMEALHFVAGNDARVGRTWEFMLSDAVALLEIAPHELGNLRSLMRKYSDRPMDYADATLVHVAERERLSLVFTTDHDDFETYRIGGKRKFQIVPART